MTLKHDIALTNTVSPASFEPLVAPWVCLLKNIIGLAQQLLVLVWPGGRVMILRSVLE